MAVGPADLQGVVATETHLSGGDVRRDTVRIENSGPGEFVDAGGAGAALADEAERQADGVLTGPLDFEDLLLFKSSDFFRWGSGHFRSFAGMEGRSLDNRDEI